MPDSLVPWSRYDWGVDDHDPETNERRRFGAWRVRLSRRLSDHEKRVVTTLFHAKDGKLTMLEFCMALPPDVKILRSRMRLRPGQVDDR